MYIDWPELLNTLSPSQYLRWPFPTIRKVESLKLFRPKVRIYIERDAYVLKTVESSWELKEALELRYRVFHQELLGKPGKPKLDYDDFDLIGDHLIIVDKKQSRIVGTYRLISSSWSSRFYSAQEFDLSELLQRPGIKLELGRACIDAEYRNGLLLALLWKGIQRYYQTIGARYLFGCSSIQTMDPSIVARCSQYFQKHGYVSSTFQFPTQPGYRFAPRLDWEQQEHPDTQKFIPPLLLSYLRSGACVGAEPALDRAFRCVDFITVMDTAQVGTSSIRRFENA